MASRKQTVAIAAACTLVFSGTAAFEGLITHPNPDPGRPHLQEVCFGDTEVEMRNYTVPECQQLLLIRLQRDYAPKVLACVPGLVNRQHELAAASDAAYNGGPGKTTDHKRGFCGSRIADRWRTGDWKGGSNLFPTWQTMPGTRVHYGVMARRYFEQCVALNLGSINYCVHYGFSKAAALRGRK